MARPPVAALITGEPCSKSRLDAGCTAVLPVFSDIVPVRVRFILSDLPLKKSPVEGVRLPPYVQPASTQNAANRTGIRTRIGGIIRISGA